MQFSLLCGTSGPPLLFSVYGIGAKNQRDWSTQLAHTARSLRSRGFHLSILILRSALCPQYHILEAIPAFLDTLTFFFTLPMQGTKNFVYVCTYTAF